MDKRNLGTSKGTRCNLRKAPQGTASEPQRCADLLEHVTLWYTFTPTPACPLSLFRSQPAGWIQAGSVGSRVPRWAALLVRWSLYPQETDYG